ncbi:MAG: methionyl-tRNA formyltransferase [Bacteroidales bacterium]|jgi:methionyl-tRNA formyltransferase|nr:methionyl-tRNA formyltransferase [Bacteroidales bacterium]
MKIIFYGTPEIAVYSLKTLLEAGLNVVAVVTSPDKPAGRGQNITISNVKRYALEKNLKILQPEKLKNPEFLSEIAKLEADIQVVVAFRMMPQLLWAMPKYGTINLHTSLLPDYRGAAPINHVIINGEKQTGVTVFKLNENIDEGDVYACQTVDILPNDTAGTLHDKLMAIGANLLVNTLKKIEQGSIETIKQDDMLVHRSGELHRAPKIFKEDCCINFNQPAQKVLNFIKGLSPYPSAFTQLPDGQILKIFDANIDDSHFHKAQTLQGQMTIANGKMFFQCQDNSLSVTDVQLSGKKRMKINDFLRGFRV